MIRHVVLVKFKSEASQAERERWLGQLRVLPEKIGFIRSLTVGTDQLHSQNSYDLALVIDFDSLGAVREYANHPAHVPVAEFGSTLTQSRISVDFEIS